jgi:hypothetical protein
MSMRRSVLNACVLATTLCGLSALGGCYYDEFRTWRMQQNDQIGSSIPPMNENCYRSLAGVDCYDAATANGASRRVQ